MSFILFSLRGFDKSRFAFVQLEGEIISKCIFIPDDNSDILTWERSGGCESYRCSRPAISQEIKDFFWEICKIPSLEKCSIQQYAGKQLYLRLKISDSSLNLESTWKEVSSHLKRIFEKYKSLTICEKEGDK